MVAAVLEVYGSPGAVIFDEFCLTLKASEPGFSRDIFDTLIRKLIAFKRELFAQSLLLEARQRCLSRQHRVPVV
jgi:hypothetical protein